MGEAPNASALCGVIRFFTNLDNGELQWQMRDGGVDLLSQSLSLSDSLSIGKILACNNFIVSVLKFLSFLEVSYMGGVISEMNYLILKYEFESLIQLVEALEKGADSKSLIFPEHFFEVAPEPSIKAVESKGQQIMSDRNKETANKIVPIIT